MKFFVSGYHLFFKEICRGRLGHGVSGSEEEASWACVPTDHFFLNFMKFFGNLDKKIGLAPPPVENHGSGRDYLVDSLNIMARQK